MCYLQKSIKSNFLINMHIFNTKFWLLREVSIIVGLPKMPIVVELTKVGSHVLYMLVGKTRTNVMIHYKLVTTLLTGF